MHLPWNKYAGLREYYYNKFNDVGPGGLTGTQKIKSDANNTSNLVY